MDTSAPALRLTHEQFAEIDRPPGAQRVFVDMRAQEQVLLVRLPEPHGFLPMLLLDPTVERFDVAIHWMEQSQRDALISCLDHMRSFSAAAQVETGEALPEEWDAEREALVEAVRERDRLTPQEFWGVLTQLTQLRAVIERLGDADGAVQVTGLEPLQETASMASQHLDVLAALLAGGA